ncbi:hypothetical protein P4475_12140 [Halalkalibacterium halodurans]|uniref:hypothetical protein n=1 Tax=Halalkalibacterium halodurans TaxID=86665 RepID=UPI00117F9506|nr:hypothetical protein [Halalkalibacterium halodurans]MED3647531.1 hypothetical protein [Halalkalibacterium halodurans]MED4123518.1 hypothetical protein [Halalkalibacterium halodurans]MED4174024.1 hypothetical protein [Halalkalibacterium halodurans]
MKKNLVLVWMATLLLLTACGAEGRGDDSSLNVMFISEVPVHYEENFGPYLDEILSDSGLDYESIEINVELFPVSHEKLTISIIEREVDIFIVDEGLRHILLDPYGLQPLDPLMERVTVDVDEFIIQDEATGEFHLYAIPLNNDSSLVKDMGLILPTPMIGAITKDSPHTELALYLLQEFYGN